VDLGPLRAGNARIAQCAAHVQLVLRVKQSRRAGAHRYAQCLKLFQIRRRNMLMIEGDDIESASKAQQVIEGIVRTHEDVMDHLGCGLVVGCRENAKANA
jgi:hypothetical protein